jgi:hypothetical protein
MCAAIVLKLCTWLYIYDLQIKFYDGCHWISFPLEEILCPMNVAILRDFTVCRFSSAMWAAISLKLCKWLNIHDLDIKFEDGCYQPIAGKDMHLKLCH